tara:strand:+ start:1813 stop:2511 length:699 start_codon:yes stop_codon:yes gene_type:complete
MKIERPRLLEIIKEEIDWARQTPVQEALQADTITRLENLLKDLSDEGSTLVGVLGTIIDQIKKDEGLQEQGEQLPELEELIDGYVEMWNAVHGPMPPALEQATRQGLSLLEPDKVGELAMSMGTSTPENTASMVADFKKRYGIGVSDISEQEQDPWKKLAGAIQEAAPPQIDPETGKYPPPPEIPDVPSIPENLQLNVIDFLETIAGLKLKGSDIISREASKLLARIEGGGA